MLQKLIQRRKWKESVEEEVKKGVEEELKKRSSSGKERMYKKEETNGGSQTQTRAGHTVAKVAIS